jgi:hypothetical protein
MISRQKTLNPWFRSIAVVTLLAWTMALVFCSEHCSHGSCHEKLEHASGHGSDADTNDPEHHSPANGDSDATLACSTLKSALMSANALTLVHPIFYQIYTLASDSFPDAIANTTSAELIFRQPPQRDLVFAPEVCLGPAFRSHAPPLSSPA